VRILKAATMAPARAAAYLGGATLLVAWLASAAGVARARPSPRVDPRPADLVQLDAVATNVQSQAFRLRARLAAAPAPDGPRRNPFIFGVRESQVRAVATTFRPRVVEAPAVPVVPDMVLELVGVAEQKTDGRVKRTAMVAAPGDQLFMVSEGQELANRYRVSAVGADAVELTDLVTGSTRRLGLR
jgi:hypothetical protein